jgi:nitroreductase
VDVFLAIASKREVRAYTDRALPEEAVRRLLEAGRLAGSSRNRQARRFVVLRDGALESAWPTALQPPPPPPPAPTVHVPDNLLGAALAVAIVVRGKGPTSFDAGRAAQNMMLAASGDGIGSCPNGVADAEALAAILGQSDDEQVATVLSFGYPARPVDAESRTPDQWIARADRRAFDEVVELRS